MRRMKPPRVALWLLARFGARYRNEALAGDLIEEFRARESRAWIWIQVLRAIAACAGSSMRARTLPNRTGPQPQGGSPQRPRGLSKYWREYRAVLAFLLLFAGYRSAWADWVYVPTGSMNPTVLEGDRLLIDKHVYGLRQQRGFALHRLRAAPRHHWKSDLDTLLSRPRSPRSAARGEAPRAAALSERPTPGGDRPNSREFVQSSGARYDMTRVVISWGRHA